MIRPAAGILFLTLLYLAVDGLVQAFSVPVPAAIVAMAVLALFLQWHKRVPDFIAAGSDALVRLFPLLFVPPLVAVADLGALLWGQAVVLFCAVVASTLVGLFITVILYRVVAGRGAAA